jgi:hypothetical protein
MSLIAQIKMYLISIKKGSFSIESNLYISSLDTNEGIKATSFLIQNVRQWQLSKHDDFDT